MKVTFSMTLVVLLSMSFSPLSTSAQDKEKSQAYIDAWNTTDLGERVEKLRQAINEAPKMLAAHYYLGRTLAELKRYDEANAAFQRLIQIPADASEDSKFLLAGHYELGKLFADSSNYEAAAAEYRWLNERKPDSLADELTLFLSDLFPKQAAEINQIPVSSVSAENNMSAATSGKRIFPMMTPSSRIVITYKEKARYTEIARINKIQGSIVLRAVFTDEGRVTDIEVIRGLPDGLTRRGIEAAQLIKFEPATDGGKPISVRGQLEFTFNLY